MQKSILEQYAHRNTIHKFFKAYWVICGCIHRRDRFEGLTQWAKRKRLIPHRNYYQRCLIDEETRLLKYRLRSPYATLFAEIAVFINTILSSKRHFSHRNRKSYRYC